MNKQAVLSLSGGMDSSTLLLHLLANGYEVTALSFDYGQKHNVELERAKDLVSHINSKCEEGQKENPNVCVGYNILGFDIPYMIARARSDCTSFCIGEFDRLGFHKFSHAKERIIKWSSSAYKNQEFKLKKTFKEEKEVKETPQPVKKAKGGKVSSASKRADGCCIRGKTRA